MTQLRKQFERHLTLGRFSPKTHEAYIAAVKGLAGYIYVSKELLSTIQSPLDRFEQISHENDIRRIQ